MKRWVCFGLAGAIWLAANVSPAAAQESPQNAAVSEILVTARKRTESLRDVPFSVSAVAATEFRRNGIDTIGGIAHRFANVTINDSNQQGVDLSIRGLASGGSGSDTSVGLYIDDVFIGSEAAIGQRLTDIESFQVLRGAQGTLFGRSSIAGALNITTNKPTPDPEFQLHAMLGNYRLRQLDAVINQPLIKDRLFSRISVVGRARDGYLKNRLGGPTGNDENGYGARAHLLFTPSDRLRVMLSVDGSDDHTCDSMFKVIAGTLYDGDPDRSQSRWNGPCKDNKHVLGGTIRADYGFSGFQLSSISAYRWRKSEFFTDRDFTQLQMLTIGVNYNDKQFTQEFRATSPGGERLNWIGGLFLYDRSWLSTTTLGFGPAYLGPGRSGSVAARADIRAFSVAGYGSVEYFLTPLLSAELGLRYTFERKRLDYLQTVSVPVPQFVPVPRLRRNVDDSEFAPQASLVYRWSPSFRSYARISRGFKAAGFNAAPSSNPASIEFQPEYLTNYELGFKSELFDRRLRLNGAVYYLDYTDIQQSQQNSAGFFISNAASARSFGGELELNLRAADNLLLAASLGYSDAKYREFGALSGNRLPRAPRWSGSASADWSFASGAWGQASFRPELGFRSRSYFDIDNTPLLAQQRHLVVNARIGIESAANWSAGVWGRNLTDRRYTVGGFALAPFGYYVTPAAPRTFGADFTVRF